jgi:ATP-dependent DNA helicase RecG
VRPQDEKRQQLLSNSCQYLKGVGPARAVILKKLGIESVDNLLTHYPRKYYDRRDLRKIADLKPELEVTFLGQILTVSQRRMKQGRTMVAAAIGDDTGIIQVVWFNQPYIGNLLKPGRDCLCSGELTYYQGARQVVNPEFELLGDGLDEQLLSTGRIVPVYPLTRGLSQRFLRGLVARTLEQYRSAIGDNLPPAMIETLGLQSRYQALLNIHFPEGADAYKQARRRLKLEELFYLQLLFSLQRKKRSTRSIHPLFDLSFDLEKRFLASFPFQLTAAQRRVLSEIHSDLTGRRGMNRLLQGDVGSGKTVVAGAALLAAVEAGYQAVLMVPTEVLAVQHFHSLRAPLRAAGIEAALLIGAVKAGEKRKLQRAIASGQVQLVIGTHAVIQEAVEFEKLGLVVIDEQHRFGVRQRAALLGGAPHPHLLVMTATPIPRTLALTAYADLDLSVIDELPPGRLAVKTQLVPVEKREKMYEFIRAEVEKGARAYLLYPLIEESENQDLQAAVSEYEKLSAGVFDGIPMGLMHGKKSFDEKTAVMEAFASGETRLLVTTTVIEVGIHVPEATLMVVHHPERFGLSQLHQLRGRVGRGDRPGYCFLVETEGCSHDARRRLNVFCKTSDGFKIAEEDLKNRGPGEFFGVRQHGVPGFKLANPLADRDLVEAASRSVKELMRGDPSLKGEGGKRCRDYLKLLVDEKIALWTVG